MKDKKKLDMKSKGMWRNESASVFRIVYMNVQGTELYKVKCLPLERTIFLKRDILVEWVGMNPRCNIGCQDVTIREIIGLGFISDKERSD